MKNIIWFLKKEILLFPDNIINKIKIYFINSSMTLINKKHSNYLGSNSVGVSIPYDYSNEDKSSSYCWWVEQEDIAHVSYDDERVWIGWTIYVMIIFSDTIRYIILTIRKIIIINIINNIFRFW